jgi:hypothetical protein
MACHTHVLGRWWQTALGTDLLVEGTGFPKGERGYHGHGGRQFYNLLGIAERVEPISLSPTCKKASPSPTWSEVTSTGGVCQDRLEGGPPSARRCFDRRRSQIKGPDNREPMPRGREEATQGGDEGGRFTPYSISPSPEDVDLVGTPIPCFLAAR